jgi:ribonucleoside-diphosphate reductase beta chain
MQIESIQDIVEKRRIFNGPEDSVRALSFTRYPWAKIMLDQMRSNDWKPEEVSLLKDVAQFKLLSEGEQTAFKRGLAFLSNLDAIQVENLAENIGQFITDPDVKKCIHRQVWEEQVHVLSYSQIIETVVPNPEQVYSLAITENKLQDKAKHITAQGKAIHLDNTIENKIKAVVSNIILEGVYFYSGFLTFYAIGNSRGVVNGSIDMIRYIHRDEITHLNLFTLVYNAVKQENPQYFTEKLAEECVQLFKSATELEISWGEYLIEGGVLGLTPKIIRQYVEYLAEKRANAIGLSVYPNSKNPVSWVDKYAEINNIQTSFFESKPKTYSRKSLSF